MSKTYDLDALKADLDREFAPLKLTVAGEDLVLRNLMRLPEKARTEVLTALKAVEELSPEEDENEEGENNNLSAEDLAAIGRNIETILVAVTDKDKGRKLADAVEGDLTLSMKIIELWVEATQPGEAQSSPA